MSDEGEKTCPLCAEEMDLTDQQLKPCKCGYEICVWCWHHIMDMAEKDDSEGRCPACRTPYDKEKIVGTGPNERLVSEINERKKSHKSKTKPSDGRKLLSTVRVIQRNLVYIVGLPLNFADEDLLQRREYFGQYGKVLKVSISRTAAGVIQQFPNNTCSVLRFQEEPATHQFCAVPSCLTILRSKYITYGKEKEAIRCIQSVHGFVLDGRSLKACFGTTKYCHAWLRNVPCTNSDCLYLHEVGSQEDSFTKDEIISAYTRSKVQQITGATSNLVRRSGSMLPLPPDDYSYGTLASTEKPIVKGATNSTTANSGKGLSPNGSYSGSAALPAAASWGMRGSNQPQNVTNDPSKPKPKPDTVTSTVGFPSAVTSTMQSAASLGEIVKKTTWNEDGQPLKSKGKPDLLRPIIQLGGDCRHIMPVKASICNTGANNIELTKDSGTADVSSVKSSLLSFSHTQEDHANSDGKSLSLHSEMSSMEKDNGATGGASGRVTRISSVHSENCAVKSSSGQKLYVEQHGQHGESIHSTGCESATSRLFVSEDENVCRMDPQTRVVADNVRELEVDLISFDNQRQSDPEVVSHTSFLSSSANLLQTEKDFWSRSLQHSNALSSVDVKAGPLFIDPGIAENQMSLPNGCPEKPMNGFAGIDRNGEYPRGRKHSGRLKCNSDGNEAVDAGESSIISDILSLDLDGWDESLTSQNLAKLLGDTDKQTSSLKMSNSRKAENSKQSRFSFARQEESRDQTPDVDLSFVGLGQIPRNHSFNHDLLESRNTYLHKHGMSNGFSSSNMDQPKSFVGATSAFPSISRAQISAPPGFSVPNRAPPPGFSSHERVDQTYNGISVNHILDTSSLHESSYQAPMTGSMGSTIDIELNDPAILAVGKGRPQGLLNNPGFDIRSNFPQQLNSYEDEARLQLLMHRSLPQHQNLVLDNFSSMADSYGISSRIMDQSQVNNLSAFAQLSLPQSRKGAVSNGHWDGWNNGGNSLGMAELLHNEKFGGLNKLYSTGYDDSKFRMQSSGDLYNRTFEM